MLERMRKAATAHHQQMLTGHADAAHQGDITSDCERCVALAANLGVDLRRKSEVRTDW